MATDTKLTKSIGEHHVAAELARHGWAAALTRDGLARTDLLAVHTRDEERRSMIEVQVKTTLNSPERFNWLLGVKAQQPAASPREWFVLVGAPTDASLPLRSFVIPRNHVAAAAWIGHETWRTDPDIAPGKRNVGPDQSRVGVSIFTAYEGRWDLLHKGHTDDVPVLLPQWMRANAQLGRIAAGASVEEAAARVVTVRRRGSRHTGSSS